MTVTSSTLIRETRPGSIDKMFRRTYTHKWRVVTNDDDDNWDTVYNQARSSTPNAIPAMWSTYSIGNGADTGVRLKEMRGDLEEPADSLRRWIVTGTWQAPEPGEEPEDSPENPLERPVRYHLEWANYTRIVEKDQLGKAPVNSAGQMFDPPIEHDDARPVLVAVRNEWPLSSIVAKALHYRNAVNTDDFYGAGKRQAKMESIITSEKQTINGVNFYTVTHRIQFTDTSWDVEVVDQGFMHFENAGDTNLIVAKELDSNGVIKKPEVAVTEPVGLEPDGTRRADTLSKLFKQPPFRKYPERSFGALGL